MTKELFVTSTPHETKVGLVEDDQLAEIYLERENEYTLAGSIYKGRVTRVLPGMQSAFVDIGLERDAFLYVSDFMELEEGDDDLTEVVSTKRAPVAESRPPQPRAEIQLPPAAENSSYVIESEPFAEEPAQEASATVAPEPGNVDTQARDRGNDRGGFRGRRGRRRGRRGEQNDRGDRGDRPSHESRFARPAADAPAPISAPTRSRSADYGPPPGYQPILLPGESI
jgi:ribonuclease E